MRFHLFPFASPSLTFSFFLLPFPFCPFRAPLSFSILAYSLWPIATSLMKKLCYLLSLLLHSLLLLAILLAEFPVTIHPGPPRLIVVRLAEPPLPFVPDAEPYQEEPPPTPGNRDGATVPGEASPGEGRDRLIHGAGPPAATASSFRLDRRAPGSFRLAPVGRSPEPWALHFAPAAPSSALPKPGLLRPGAGTAALGGDSFRLSFDARERVVANWTEAALARIERNWIIPASARLAFAGRVQVTLTVEKRGRKRSLIVDDSDLPATLTLAALRAVEASLPLPPLPDEVAGETFTFTFVFRYNG